MTLLKLKRQSTCNLEWQLSWFFFFFLFACLHSRHWIRKVAGAGAGSLVPSQGFSANYYA
jgi:hypothetical protein